MMTVRRVIFEVCVCVLSLLSVKLGPSECARYGAPLPSRLRGSSTLLRPRRVGEPAASQSYDL